ncbi:MAG: hypothetical protein IJC76_00010 [Lachnospiraceae bacterium]|nr:hypothetical protein [Lachnospiraceae bacterium]
MENRNNAGRDLGLFLLGLAMCAGGLYLFLNNVVIETSLWGSNSRVDFFGTIGGGGIPSGMITIPFIIGIVLLFFAPKSIWPKIVTGLGLLIILLGVISSTTLRFKATSSFNYILMVILIFGGAAMVLRILLMGGYSEGEEKKKNKSQSVDDMLDEMKK